MADIDFDYYKSLDFSNARRANLNPKIKKLQENIRLSQNNDLQNILDSDVIEIIQSHNNPHDKQRLNGMIRLLFA